MTRDVVRPSQTHSGKGRRDSHVKTAVCEARCVCVGIGADIASNLNMRTMHARRPTSTSTASTPLPRAASK